MIIHENLFFVCSQYFEYNQTQNINNKPPPNNRPKQLPLQASSYLSIGHHLPKALCLYTESQHHHLWFLAESCIVEGIVTPFLHYIYEPFNVENVRIFTCGVENYTNFYKIIGHALLNLSVVLGRCKS